VHRYTLTGDEGHGVCDGQSESIQEELATEER